MSGLRDGVVLADFNPCSWVRLQLYVEGCTLQLVVAVDGAAPITVPLAVEHASWLAFYLRLGVASIRNGEGRAPRARGPA